MKLKQRILILERAYDKASKYMAGTKSTLAELEGVELRRAIRDYAESVKATRKEYSAAVWKHFGWDKPEAQEKYQQMLKDIRDGRRI